MTTSTTTTVPVREDSMAPTVNLVRDGLLNQRWTSPFYFGRDSHKIQNNTYRDD